MTKITKIKVKLGKRGIELTPAEVRELYKELDLLFGHEVPPPQPYPVLLPGQPVYVPIYIEQNPNWFPNHWGTITCQSGNVDSSGMAEGTTLLLKC